MLRALWFVIKTGLLVAVAVWVANRPGQIDINWQGYEIKTQVGLALLAVLILVLFSLLLYKILHAFVTFPASWNRYRDYGRRHKGLRALTLGLTAVAAGDAKMANYHSHRARKFMAHDKGLTVLLEAQAARLKGDDKAAHGFFEKLMANSDTSFLGLRGLLVNALERGETNQASELAQRALALHPKQPWALRMAYDLKVRQGHWNDALKLLEQGIKQKALDEGRAMRDRVALLLQEAEEFMRSGNEGAALARLKQARNADPAFVPAALALAKHYLSRDNLKAAADVIEKAWKEHPHPELAELWHEAIPKKMGKDSAGRMKWFERLVALRPDDAEGQLAAAAAAIENGLWGSARAYLDRASSMRVGPRLYRLRARLAQALDRPEEATLMLRKAAEAAPEKTWVCKESGRVYDRWSPIAQPHGSFNTIVWDHPLPEKTDSAANDRSELLITAPAGRN
ncbi:MAG TPA: heme biosynthesis HemY N-terminal domain-containing protein [Patescibacteria group bacterium]|nr:heme biosynthesis HemY N-terminal domain-containing protein [Patescibacteria group bacterium]